MVGIHHWLVSLTLVKPIACVICPKKTRYYEEYVNRIEKESGKFQKDP